MNLAEIFFKSALQLVSLVQIPVWNSFRIAGFNIRIGCLNEKMASLIYPALSHLQSLLIAPQCSDLTIYVVDQQSMPRPLKLLSGYQTTIATRGEIPHLCNSQIISIYNHHDGAFNLIHLKKNIAIYWVRSTNHMPWWIAGSPLQRIIACWMRQHGLELTHTAAIGNSRSAVLLAGKSGSGKSTLTLSCVESGLFYLSEDYCLISASERPSVYSVYNSIKITQNTINHFPYLEKNSVNLHRQKHEKALLFQNQIQPKSICFERPINAVVALTVGEKINLKKCHPSVAVLALSASTVLQLSSSLRETVSHFKSVCLKNPCYQLTLGPSFEKNVSAIKQLLDLEGCML